MALYTKFRSWVIWLFWFYIRYGKEATEKKILWGAVGVIAIVVVAYDEINISKRFIMISLEGFITSFFLIAILPFILVIYGYFFGHRHQLEQLDPVYTRPSIWEPIGFFIMMMAIGLARVNGWW